MSTVWFHLKSGHGWLSIGKSVSSINGNSTDIINTIENCSDVPKKLRRDIAHEQNFFNRSKYFKLMYIIYNNYIMFTLKI